MNDNEKLDFLRKMACVAYELSDLKIEIIKESMADNIQIKIGSRSDVTPDDLDIFITLLLSLSTFMIDSTVDKPNKDELRKKYKRSVIRMLEDL